MVALREPLRVADAQTVSKLKMQKMNISIKIKRIRNLMLQSRWILKRPCWLKKKPKAQYSTRRRLNLFPGSLFVRTSAQTMSAMLIQRASLIDT